MDGFRDRMNRGASDRGSYDRYDRGSRRQSFGSGAQYGAPQPSVNIDEIAQIVDESNEKQLQIVADFFDEAKDDRFQSEKEIIAALDSVKSEVAKAAEAVAAAAQPVVNEPVEEVKEEDSELTKEIYRAVTANSDILSQLAEEQVSMLIRGNSAILNQIRESLIENDETLKEILRNSSAPQVAAPATSAMYSDSSSDEILNTATTNNALLNALRSDIAGIQSEIRSANDRISANADDNNEPLDAVETATKSHVDEMSKYLEDAVHSECVKVYRNIQKVLEDQNAAVADTVKRGLGGVKALSIINLILLILNLAATIAKILDLI